MSSFYRDNEVVVSLDPGFDGVKMVVNGITFHIPNAIVDITGREGDFITGGTPKEGYILSHYIKGKPHIIGEQAELLMFEKRIKEKYEETMGTMESFSKFTTLESEISLCTAIGYGLVYYNKFAKEHDLPEIDLSKPLDENHPNSLYVAVALPNDAVEDVWPSMQQILSKRHCFEFETNDGKYSVDFTLTTENTTATSQVKDAMLGILLDDNGELYDEVISNEFAKDLPAVVVDGGYKTIADFELSKNMMVARSESNTEYAMLNVNRNVSKIIKEEYGRDYNHHQIKSKIKNDNGELVYKKGDTTAIANIKEIRDRELEKMAGEYIQHLCEKYDDFLEHRKLVIAGGTGAAYHEYIKDYVDKHMPHLSDKIVLTDYKFFGAKISPVFAIAIGQYKAMKAMINESKGTQE